MHCRSQRQTLVLAILVTALTVAGSSAARAQAWEEPVRGSWLRDGDTQPGDIALAEPGKTCQIVVSERAHSAVRQAANFLSADFAKLAGAAAPIVGAPTPG